MARGGAQLKAFGAFWWDFIVGDDWRIAAGVVAALVLTAVLSGLQVPSWWVIPAAAIALLTLSLVREVRRRP